ncbi:MAG: hypothetical protein ACPG1A_14245 [Halioglobus sp.]
MNPFWLFVYDAVLGEGNQPRPTVEQWDDAIALMVVLLFLAAYLGLILLMEKTR